VGGSSFTFEWNGDQVSKDVAAAARHGITRAGIQLQRQMTINLSRKGPSTPGAMPAQGDTGNLAQSITTNQTPNGVKVGTPLDYGRHLEYGFTARAKGKGALPVPLNKEARKMLRAASVSGGLKSVGHDLVLIQRKGRPPLLVQVKGKGTRGGKAWKPMFVLKKSVTVAPRPWVLRSAAMAGAKMREAFYGESSKMLARSASARMKGAA
jgi:phage gpG-like protein